MSRPPAIVLPTPGSVVSRMYDDVQAQRRGSPQGPRAKPTLSAFSLRRLLASSSLAALVVGGGAPAAFAVTCDINDAGVTNRQRPSENAWRVRKLCRSFRSGICNPSDPI
ncbi:MAG TPA: hypothetical protein VKX28_05115 [Xanthobacteraceae bacterium]|nr:hypothetical protein [Xanthobacteraceae bacterium]